MNMMPLLTHLFMVLNDWNPAQAGNPLPWNHIKNLMSYILPMVSCPVTESSRNTVEVSSTTPQATYTSIITNSIQTAKVSTMLLTEIVQQGYKSTAPAPDLPQGMHGSLLVVMVIHNLITPVTGPAQPMVDIVRTIDPIDGMLATVQRQPIVDVVMVVNGVDDYWDTTDMERWRRETDELMLGPTNTEAAPG